jgi:glutamate synthase domain-containing protein 3
MVALLIVSVAGAASLIARFGLPPDMIQLTFKGSAGQSFGAFVPRGAVP